jgi:hypothetical protein
MTSIGFFTPTLRGEVWLLNRATVMLDVVWAAAADLRVVDMSRYVSPSNSIECSRNLAIERAVNEGCAYLYMLDSNVASESHINSPLAELFLAMQYPCNCAVAAGAVVPVNGGKAGKINATGIAQDEARDVEYVSAAMMLIDLQALLELGKSEGPWFKRVHNPGWTQTTVDEGFFFSHQIRDLGGRVIATWKVPTIHRTSGTNRLPTWTSDGNRAE